MTKLKFHPGILTLIAAAVLWGVTFLITKWALDECGPLTLSALRFSLALAVMYPFAHRQGFRFRLCLQPRFLLFGFTGIALGFGLQNIGLMFTTATNGALLDAVQPMFILVLSVIFLKERLTSLRLAGVLLSVAGVVLIALPPAFGAAGGLDALSSGSMTGTLILLASITAWGVFSVQAKHISNDHSSVVMSTASFGSGLVFIIPLALGEVFFQGAPHLTLLGIYSILYLGIGASALAFFLWNYGLHFVDASVAAPFMNLIPVVGVIAGFLAGEPISGFQLAGGATAVAGVWLCSL